MAGEVVRATLRGHSARLGQVRARDLARLIVGVESALAAAAYATLGRPRTGPTGRHRAAVEAVTRLSFRGVRAGSVVAELVLPVLAQDGSNTLGVVVDDLAGAAFDRLVASFHEPDHQVEPSIARALADLAEQLGIGERNRDLGLDSDRPGRGALLDVAARARMRTLADAPLTSRSGVLVGSLREVDVDRGTARLRTAGGEPVVVSYPSHLEDQIVDALRGHAQFEGVVSYDPTTLMARRVDVHRVSTSTAVPFDPDEFWTPASVAAAARAQGVDVAALDRPFVALTPDELHELDSALKTLDA